MKQLRGIVTGVKMQKTAVVAVERIKVHPIYKKGIKSTKKYHVHDELGVKVKDIVKIAEARPISKTKKWKIVEVIKK